MGTRASRGAAQAGIVVAVPPGGLHGTCGKPEVAGRRQLLRSLVLGAVVVGAGAMQLTASGADGLERLLGDRSVSEWTEITVDTSRDVGQSLDVAIVPGTGIPYVSYFDDAADDLWLARFVGTGGNCGPGSSWSCQLVDSAGEVGGHNSIAVRHSLGTSVEVIIAYHDATNAALKYARGECDAAACVLSNHTIQTGTVGLVTRGLHTAVTFYGSIPFIAYQSALALGDEAVRVASPSVFGIGNCGVGDVEGYWRCDTILSGEGMGAAIDLASDIVSDELQLAFYDPTTGIPYHANWVGSDGNCGPSDEWSCRNASIPNHDCGRSISLAVAPDGTPHLAFVDQSAAEVVHAWYVGEGGDCGFSNTSQQWEWRCDYIENIGNVGAGRTVALALDGSGAPMIAYRDISDTTAPPALRFAQPYSAAPTGAVPNCVFYTWVCTTMDGGGASQEEAASVAMSSSSAGVAIAYHELDTYAFPAEGNLKLIMQLTPFFADGFETGNMNAWSSHVP